MKLIQTIAFLVIGVGITLLGDIFLKKSDFINLKYLGLGMLLYALVAIPVAAAFKFNQFGIIILMWEAIIVCIGLVVGLLVFKEPISTLKILTLIMAVITIVLSYFASK